MIAEADGYGGSGYGNYRGDGYEYQIRTGDGEMRDFGDGSEHRWDEHQGLGAGKGHGLHYGSEYPRKDSM
jgi:hypothetical protein